MSTSFYVDTSFTNNNQRGSAWFIERLRLFNDTIVREANAAHVPIIDLRNICTEAGDYSAVSPIEPSAQGGEKIAKAIVAMLG